MLKHDNRRDGDDIGENWKYKGNEAGSSFDVTRF
jgi:hypothetical protein